MSTFQCCVCGQPIADRQPVGTLAVPVLDDGLQEFQAHASCLAGVLHPSVPIAWDTRGSWTAPAPLRAVLGSDLERDALFLELTHDSGEESQRLAEAVFDERTREITVQADFAALRFDEVAGFLRLTRNTFYPGLDPGGT